MQDQPDQPKIKALADLTEIDFEARKVYESDPQNYVVEIYPQSLAVNVEFPDLKSGEKKIAALQSGFVDLRDATKSEAEARTVGDSRYAVWLGQDHMEVSQGIKFPRGPETRQYMIGIKTYYDPSARKITIDRRNIGNPSDRSDKQVEALISAAEKRINQSLILENPFLQKQYFLHDYVIAHMKDISPEQVYQAAEDDVEEMLSPDQKYQLMLLPAIAENFSSDELKEKIVKLSQHLLDNPRASIRIPFKLNDGESDPVSLVVSDLEEQHPELECSTVYTRDMYTEKDGEKILSGHYGCLIVRRSDEA